MDRDHPTGSSARPSWRVWSFRLLLSLLLAVGYAFCYFVVPKIEVSYNAQGLRVPGWVIVLSSCGHLFVKYGPAILLVLAASILLRRWPRLVGSFLVVMLFSCVIGSVHIDRIRSRC